MKIEAGKYYRTRDGDVAGPMRHNKDQSWSSWYHTWNEDGGIFLSGAEHGLDLISEVHVSDTPPETAPAPEAKTLRDELVEKAALAILNGHYANPDSTSSYGFAELWLEAELFVEAREK